MTSSLATAWLPWVCLAVMGLGWLSCVMQPRYLSGLISNSFAGFAINGPEQIPSIGSQVTQWLFNSIVPAIEVYVLVAQSAVYGVQLLGRLLLLALLIDGLRALTAIIVQYTFSLGKVASLAYMRYFALRSLFTFVLFIVVLMIAHSNPSTAWFVVLGLLVAIYLITLIVQWARLFCTSILDVVSMIIFLLTVELLPTFLLYEAGNQLYFTQSL